MASHKSIQRVLFGVFFVALFASCMQPPPPLPPTITTSSPLPTAIVGEEYAVSLKAAHGEPPLRWSGSPPTGLKLDPNSGQITGKPDRAGTFRFKVAVKDSARRSEAKFFELRITPNVPLAITTDSLLPEVVEEQRYSKMLEAIGGRGQLSWSSNNLADDFTLQLRTGVIAGTPKRAGTFTFDVKVIDSANQCATKRFVLTVLQTLNITTVSPLRDATVGQDYSVKLLATGGKPPLKWLLNKPPVGLTLNEETGEISGKPAAAGEFNVDVTVTDSSTPPRHANKTFKLTVKP